MIPLADQPQSEAEFNLKRLRTDWEIVLVKAGTFASSKNWISPTKV